MRGTIDASQRRAARVVGWTYLLVIPIALFAEAVVTPRNLLEHERLFRLGTASNLGAFALDVALIAALYVVLEPVDRTLALLAAFLGLIETAILVVATLSDLEALRVLSGADYLRAFDADRLQALARLSLGGHSAAYQVGLVLGGLRSAAFGYLWLRSRYIPKALAAWGVFSSLLLTACTYAFIVFPELKEMISVAYYGGPIFIFEVVIGFWLLLKGLPPSGVGKPDEGVRASTGAA
jgi:hypothetical protein